MLIDPYLCQRGEECMFLVYCYKPGYIGLYKEAPWEEHLVCVSGVLGLNGGVRPLNFFYGYTGRRQERLLTLELELSRNF